MPFSLSSMILRDPVLRGRIIFRALNRAQFTLAGDAAFKLRTDLIAGSFLKRVGATGHKQQNRDR